MNSAILDEPESASVEHCLVQMKALGRELQAAIGFIERNLMVELEQSVATQRDCSTALVAIVTRIMQSSQLIEKQPAMASRLRQAANRVLRLNEQYAALLEHSGRSMRMLQMLYQSGSGLAAEKAQSSIGLPNNWSCKA